MNPARGEIPLDSETTRIRRIYEREAHRYDAQMRLWDKFLFGGGRNWACSQANGTVLEIAVGTGRNLPYYPAHVSLTGIELSPAMLAIAAQRAEQLDRAMELRLGDAQQLPFEDESFDCVVITLALCSIPDERATVSETWRVLRPGGRLLLLEHVASPLRSVRAVQRLLEPIANRFSGDHLLREPLDHLRAEAFEVEKLARSKLGIVERIAARRL